MSREDFESSAGAAPDADGETATPTSDVDTPALIPQVNARRDVGWRPRNVTDSPGTSAAIERRERSLEIFGQPDWTLHQALAWICYRDRERMCDLSEGAYRRLVLYNSPKGEAGNANCAETLRCALVEVRLAAFRNDQAVPPAHWMGRTLLWPEWRGFHCHSKAVLEIWPDASADAPDEIERPPSQHANAALDAIPQKKVRCAARALRHLKLPEGMSADRRLEAVNSYLKEHNDGMTVSPPILRTALKELAKVLPETSEDFRKLL